MTAWRSIGVLAAGASLAIVSGSAHGRYSFAPGEGLVAVALALPFLAGIAAGILSGLRWSAWKALPAGSAAMLAALLLFFLRERWSFFAPVAVPSLLAVYVACHGTAHAVTRRRSRRAGRKGAS